MYPEDREINEKLASEKQYNQHNLGQAAPGVYGMAGQPKSLDQRLADIFSYHDDPDASPRYVAIRSAAKHFAEVIMQNSPAGQDQSLAVLYVRQAVMFANAAVALNGRTI